MPCQCWSARCSKSDSSASSIAVQLEHGRAARRRSAPAPRASRSRASARRRRSAPTRRAGPGPAPGSRSTHAAQSSPRSRISSTPSGSSIVTRARSRVSQTSGGMYGLSGTSRSSSSAAGQHLGTQPAPERARPSRCPPGRRSPTAPGGRARRARRTRAPSRRGARTGRRRTPPSPVRPAPARARARSRRDGRPSPARYATASGSSGRTKSRWPRLNVPSGPGVEPRNSDRSWLYSCHSRSTTAQSSVVRDRSHAERPQPPHDELGQALGQQAHQLEVLRAGPHRVVLVGLVLAARPPRRRAPARPRRR